MNIVIEEIVVNPLIQIEETIEEITIAVSEMQMPGATGADGKRAYQSALDGGFVGSELEFNTFLSEVDKLDNISGTNTGDETASTIINKIGDGSKINQSYLPSYVDDILEFDTVALFPSVGELSKIYIVTTGVDINKQYRWTGSLYAQITNGLIASTNDVQEGINNLYFTTSRVLYTLLTGISIVTGGVISATDSVLIGLGKLQKQISDNLVAIELKANNSEVVHLAETETITGQKTFSPTISASVAIARGTYLIPSLTATANNDVLVGLDIVPTFNTGAFTGIGNYAIRHIGDISPMISNSYNLGGQSTPYATVYSRIIRDLSSISYRCDTQGWFNNSNTQVGKLFASTGNWIFQNGGAFTDLSSAKIQINSTTQGFLPPRMTNAQRTAIASPAIGLVVYCTDATEGLYVNKSTGWALLL